MAALSVPAKNNADTTHIAYNKSIDNNVEGNDNDQKESNHFSGIGGDNHNRRSLVAHTA
jgi:hypothetical protein